MIPEIILILSFIMLSIGVYFVKGLGYALIAAGVYLGVVAFTMALKRDS